MRTNIDIDNKLMEQALKLGGFRTKKEAVEAGLHLLVQRASQLRMVKYFGKLPLKKSSKP